MVSTGILNHARPQTDIGHQADAGDQRRNQRHETERLRHQQPSQNEAVDDAQRHRTPVVHHGPERGSDCRRFQRFSDNRISCCVLFRDRFRFRELNHGERRFR